METEKTILITGATGNIGARIAADLLESDRSARLVLLVRADSNEHAERRVASSLTTVCPSLYFNHFEPRVCVLSGDITDPDLGLAPSVYEKLTARLTHVIHSAASTKFHLSLADARLINCSGTENVMRLAQKAHARGRLKGVAHISTAFVCGDRQGEIYEHDLFENTAFANSYEQSKWETEKKLAASAGNLPLTIFRPSIVVGDAANGSILSYNVLYTPLKFIRHGKLSVLPCSAAAPLDVVPVDYVSRAVNHILFNYRAAGRTFHLVASHEKVVTVGDIVRQAAAIFSRELDDGPIRVRFVPASLYHGMSRLVTEKTRRGWRLLEPYLPYIQADRMFDNVNTLAALQGTGITVPRLTRYLPIILKHCLEVDWGKKRLQAA